MNLAHAKINITLIFLVSLVIITNCGASDSSDVGVESQHLVSAEPTVAPEPTATPFPTATPTPTPRPAPGYIYGSHEWWTYVAPPLEFRQNSDLARSARDISLGNIYASVFILQSYLNGTEPWEQDYGQFVRSLPYDDLPEFSAKVFGELLEVDVSESWTRPYFSPLSLQEMGFSIYPAWGGCLVDRTWEHCEFEIGNTILELR